MCIETHRTALLAPQDIIRPGGLQRLLHSRGGVTINVQGRAAVQPASAHTHSEAAGLASRVMSNFICFHAILTQECPGTICLCVQAALPFLHVRMHVQKCGAREPGRKRERESVQQLYLHLYEQIPVGRMAEEHTSCLTYIHYQAVFVDTHTHTTSTTAS